MSTTFKTLITVLAVVALLLVASGASAAINRPGKARFEKSNSRSRQHVAQSTSVQPMRIARTGDVRQSYSFEPAAKMAPATGSCHQHAAAAPATQQQDVAKAPQVTRRSHSYEPAEAPAIVTRGTHRAAVKRDPWLYPKGDPRRYQ